MISEIKYFSLCAHKKYENDPGRPLLHSSEHLKSPFRLHIHIVGTVIAKYEYFLLKCSQFMRPQEL